MLKAYFPASMKKNMPYFLLFESINSIRTKEIGMKVKYIVPNIPNSMKYLKAFFWSYFNLMKERIIPVANTPKPTILKKIMMYAGMESKI